jgi:hypothetical protein
MHEDHNAPRDDMKNILQTLKSHDAMDAPVLASDTGQASPSRLGLAGGGPASSDAARPRGFQRPEHMTPS